MSPKYIFYTFVLLFLISCKRTSDNKPIQNLEKKNRITHAKGFTLQEYSKYKKLTILTSFQRSDTKHEYYLISKSETIIDSLKEKNIIRIPIERIVVTSTTHIPMLELLGAENTLVGFPNTKYISSQKTRQLIDQNQIKELGKEQNINTEILIDLQPELVVGFGVSNTSKVFENIQKMGVPVIMNSDWLEKTPLGRAEWLRFFGALYDKDSLALTKFNTIVNNYNSIKEKAAKIKQKPSLMSGSLFQDVWHIPAGESFIAQYLKDAQTNYIWKDTKGTGSIPLSLEVVLDQGKNADFWISPGYNTTKKMMLQESAHYTEFKAFQTNKIYTNALKKGETGGIIYFELATTRPDLVLQDMVQIFHPEIFPAKEMTFFNKVE